MGGRGGRDQHGGEHVQGGNQADFEDGEDRRKDMQGTYAEETRDGRQMGKPAREGVQVRHRHDTDSDDDASDDREQVGGAEGK